MAFKDREQAFARPKTKKAILGEKGLEREIIHVNRFEDIVPTHESRSNNQIVMISPSVTLIPPEFYSAANFGKRGQYVKLQTLGKQESINQQWSPIKSRIKANLDLQDNPSNPNNRFVAWYWMDTNGTAHILEPWQLIQGRRIEMYGHLSPDIEDKVEVIKPYSAKDSDVFTIRTRVPSTDRDIKHSVDLKKLTRLSDPSRHFEWTRLSSGHACKYKQESEITFRFAHPYRHCMHEVAAHSAYSRKVGEKSRRIVLQPFPMITEPFLRLALSSTYDTLKIDLSESGRIKTRPLIGMEINPILMDAWERYGNHDTLWVSAPSKGHKKMSEYDWSNSAAGMPFKQK